MGFYPTASRNSRVIVPFSSKHFKSEDLAQSSCYPSLPVVARRGGHQQGQKRDKFPNWQQAALAFLTALYGVLYPIASAFSNRRRPLIYTRYSSDLQSDRSNEDQEREVRLLFRQKGIDDSDAFVIHDRAVSGTTNGRPGFLEMQRLVGLGLVFVIGVEDQSRASRNDDVIGVVKDMVFRGTRFLSGDGVDTTEKGWQLKVRLLGIQNAASGENKAQLVRRGMKGRILDNKSAGDFPYGYASRFDDPEYAANYFGKGPRPAKSITIYEPHAKWLRQIFQWVADGMSFGKVALKLQELKAPVGRNVKRWTPKVVSRLVRNKKYTGEEWTWGATMIIRDSNGHKKQVPAPADEVAHASRPQLRIIDADLWEGAQAKVNRIDGIFGFKEGQKRRGFKVHFSHVYPRNILFTLLRCGECGAEMYQNMSRELEYRQCKNTGPGPDDCRAKTRVPAVETKKVLTEFVADLLLSVPEWLDAAIAVMNDAVLEQQTKLPKRIEECQLRHRELVGRRRRLIELVETGELKTTTQLQQAGENSRGQSSIRERIDELDREIAGVAGEIAQYEQQLDHVVKLPDRDFIVTEIEKLPCTLRTDESKAAQLLGELFEFVRVYRVTLPGKQRGYHQLKFRLKAWRIICTALDGKLPSAITAIISQDDVQNTCISPEFCLNVGGPTRADEASAYIVKRRLEGATWDELRAETGLSRNTIRECFMRYQRVTGSGSLPEDSENESGEHDSGGSAKPDVA
jgi:site-specific DNA recombinase